MYVKLEVGNVEESKRGMIEYLTYSTIKSIPEIKLPESREVLFVWGGGIQISMTKLPSRLFIDNGWRWRGKKSGRNGIDEG